MREACGLPLVGVALQGPRHLCPRAAEEFGRLCLDRRRAAELRVLGEAPGLGQGAGARACPYYEATLRRAARSTWRRGPRSRRRPRRRSRSAARAGRLPEPCGSLAPRGGAPRRGSLPLPPPPRPAGRARASPRRRRRGLGRGRGRGPQPRGGGARAGDAGAGGGGLRAGGAGSGARRRPELRGPPRHAVRARAAGPRGGVPRRGGPVPDGELEARLLAELGCALEGFAEAGDAIRERKRAEGRLPRSWLGACAGFVAHWLLA